MREFLLRCQTLTTIVALLGLAACGIVGPDDSRLDIAITVESQNPWITDMANNERRIECTMTFEASATGSSGAFATWGTGERRWYAGTDRVSPVQVDELTSGQVSEFWQSNRLDAGATATTTWTFWAPAAYLLEQEFEYTVDGKPRTASVRQGCGLDPDSLPAPPVLANVKIEFPDTLEPADGFHVAFDASAAGWLWESRIEVRGAYEDSVILDENLAPASSHLREFVVPPGTPLGRTVMVTVYAIDAAGQRSTVVSRESTPLVDVTPPTLDLVQVADGIWPFPDWHLRGQWAVTDTMRLNIAATDNSGVDYLMARIGPDALVIPYVGLSYGDVIRIPVRPEWLGAPAVSFTATDRQGLTSAPFDALPDSIRIYPVATYPTTSWAVPGNVVDIAWDDARDRLYVATTDSDVVVLSTPALAVVRRIPLPDLAGALDFNAAGDTLLVTLPSHGSIALIDLHTDALLEIPVSADGMRPKSARLLGDGTALVELVDAQNEGHAAVVDVASGAVVTEAAGRVTRIARSRDRSLAVVRTTNNCVHLYRPATRAFGGCIGMDTNLGTLTIDASAERILNSDRLIDLADGGVRRPAWGISSLAQYTTAFANDGESFYLSEWKGIVRIRASDGVILERFAHPARVHALLVSADGSELLSLSGVGDEPVVHTIRHMTLQ